MDLFWLKIIGIITMFIDHYHFVIGGSLILNIIGRLAFPIFAFSLNEGYFHTSNLKKYLIRLFIFAIIIQIPAILFKLNYPVNIFFTLFFCYISPAISDSRMPILHFLQAKCKIFSIFSFIMDTIRKVFSYRN